MKAKRVLAAVLCAAMIFTSEGFGMNVAAAPADGDVETVTEDSEEQGVVTEEESPEETDETEKESENAPDAADVPQESETPTAEETPSSSPDDESRGEEESPVPTDIPTETAEPEQTEMPETIPEESTSPVPSVTPETEAVMIDETAELVGASSDVLTVENGVLGIREDVVILPGTLLIPDEVTEIPAALFKNKNVQIVKFGEESQLTSIGAGAFEGSSLTTINIPKGVTEIREDTFKNSALEKLTFDAGTLESIGEEAFMNTNLTSFHAPDSLQSIGEGAFASCFQLTYVSLNNVKSVGIRAFQNCKKISVSFGSGLRSVGAYAFQGSGLSSIDMTGISAGSENDITIDDGAFAACTELTSVRLPGSLKTVSSKLFADCKALTKVTIPDSVTLISNGAFDNCTALKNITIPGNVMAIMSKAFSTCSALQEVYIYQEDTSADDFVIAEDAFPAKTGVTMWGFDGKVQDYAEKMHYTYKTLNPQYTIVMGSNFGDYASLTIDKNPAAVGEKVTLTITPKNGYCLKEGTVEATGKEDAVVSLVSCTSQKQVFSFIMPEGKQIEDGRKVVFISAQFLSAKDAAPGELGYKFDSGYTMPEINDKDKYTLSKTGEQSHLLISSGNQTIGSWLLTYKSSNTKVATVSDTGIISAKGKGDTTITVSLNSDASKKISFILHVGQDAVIDYLELNPGTPARSTRKSMTVDETENGVSVTRTYKVVEFNKDTLAASSQTFEVSLNAKESSSDANLIVDSVWTTTDSTIAAPASSKSSENRNKVTVKKGVEGETMITVTVTNKDGSVCKDSFIVRVVDATPRLADSKITVNSLSTTGTGIDIVPVYGYDINREVELKLCKKKVVNGLTSYDSEYDGLRIEYDEAEDVYRIVATGELELASGKSKSFKGAGQLFIRGEFERGGSFIIPVPEITIINKELNPTVKLTGKINLFYNSTASMQEQGSIKVSQSLTNETVERYELVSAANDKKRGSEEVDSFAANFDIDENGIITRSDRETLVQVNGKDVVSGYLYLYYEGYNKPVKRSIKLSTCNTSPSYVLSRTSATASVYKADQSYALYLLDKKTKNKIDLSGIDTLSLDFSNKGSTRELFEDLTADSVKLDEEGHYYIDLHVAGKPVNGRAVFNVKMSTWSRSLKYTFTLKTTSGLASVKFTPSTATLNNLCKSQETVLKAVVNQEDAQMSGFERETLTYTGNSKYAQEAEKLSFVFGDDSITVSLPSEGTVKPGTYSFKVRPVIKYGDREQKLNYLSFKVTVNGSIPTVKLKSNTLSLNAKCPGIEEVSTTFTLTSLPAGSTYTILSDGLSLSPVSSKNTAAKDMAENIHLTCEDNKIIVKLDEDGFYTKSFSYDYYVKGLKIRMGGESEEVEVKEFKIKIKGNLTNPSIKVSAKGTLNPVDPTSRITYTAKVGNISSDISSISIRELNLTDNRNDYYRDEAGNPISEHFELVKEGNTAILKAKDGITLKAGTRYKIQLVYKLTAVSGQQYVTGDITITPKQTLPKIKTNRTNAYLYAGQNREKSVDVSITKTSLTGAEITGVDFVKETPEAIRRAYRISYDEENGVMTLKLVNPSLLVMNKKYTITFETKCKNQLENSKGTTFKMDVTVRK